MQIANIDAPGGWRIAVVDAEFVIDLNRATQLSLAGSALLRDSLREEANQEMPSDIAAWLRLGLTEALERARRAAARGRALLAEHGPEWAAAHQLAYPAKDAVLAPPVAPHANIMGLGLNYKAHVLEAGRPMPEYPLIFSKPSSALLGPNSTVTIPKASHRIDYEGELTVVIGRKCKEIPEDAALDYVAGYTLANDVSARDWQFRTTEIMIGKAFDGFCPIGPWLVTADEIPDPQKVRLETRVNGDLRQDTLISDMIFSVPRIVSYLSQVMTLEPGDAILTGTPGGIGAARKPRLWLRPGDRVDITGTPIGTLTTIMQ